MGQHDAIREAGAAVPLIRRDGERQMTYHRCVRIHVSDKLSALLWIVYVEVLKAAAQ